MPTGGKQVGNNIQLLNRYSGGHLDLIKRRRGYFDPVENPFPGLDKGLQADFRVTQIYTDKMLIETIAQGFNFETQLVGTANQGYYTAYDLNGLMREFGYSQGIFNIHLLYLRTLFNNVRFYIEEIGASRTEIKIGLKPVPFSLNEGTAAFLYANEVYKWWGRTDNLGQDLPIANYVALNPNWNMDNSTIDDLGNLVMGFHRNGTIDSSTNKTGYFEFFNNVLNMQVDNWYNIPRGINSNNSELTLSGGAITAAALADAIVQPGRPQDLAPSHTNPGFQKDTYESHGPFPFGQALDLSQWLQVSALRNRFILVKFTEEIDPSIEEGHDVSFAMLHTEPRKIPIKLETALPEQEFYEIKPPNFSLRSKTAQNLMTEYQTWDNILGDGNSSTRQELLNTYFSSSIKDEATLNIDYRKFDNFVHFSSAEERLKNFKFKLQLIEYYDSKIQALKEVGSSGSYWSIKNIDEYDSKINNMVNGFDGYERFLYFSSGSGHHGQTPYDKDVHWLDNKEEYVVSSWPKQNLRRPYELYSVSSSEATNWYNGMLTSASLYDGLNPHNLEKLVPSHISADPNNSNYYVFVNMIGQHFDTLYNYVDHLTQTYDRDEYLYDGLSKDLVYDTLKSLGWEPHDGYAFDDLWSYALGKTEEGGYGGQGIGSMAIITSGGTNENVFMVGALQSEQAGSVSTFDLQSPASESISRAEVTREQWKRILNNLPYIRKTQGSERSIRALINTYGLPPSILRTVEYGGVAKSGSAGQILPRDSFKYALDFSNGAYLQTPWKNFWVNEQPSGGPIKSPSTGGSTGRYRQAPTSVEFRFNTTYKHHQMLAYCSSSTTHQVGASATPTTYFSEGTMWWMELQAHDSASNESSGFYNHGKINFYLQPCGVLISGNQGDDPDFVSGGSPSGSDASVFIMASGSTEWLPLFDNDWWNVEFGPKYMRRNEDAAATLDYNQIFNTIQLRVAKAADYGNGRITHSGSLEVGNWKFDNWSDSYYLGALSYYNTSLDGIPFENGAGWLTEESGFSNDGTGRGTNYINWGRQPDSTVRHIPNHVTGSVYKKADVATGSYGVSSFSGSLQEIRYWLKSGYDPDDNTVSGLLDYESWEAHVKDPLSIEARFPTSSLHELKRRWSLGLEGLKSPMTGSGGFGGIRSEHPLHHGKDDDNSFSTFVFLGTPENGSGATDMFGDNWYYQYRDGLDLSIHNTMNHALAITENPYYASGSGFTGTSDDWVAEEERMFVTMPEIIGTSQIGDKVRIDDTVISGTLSPAASIASSSLTLASRDSNVVGVYFSPNDMIDIDIARTIGGGSFDDFVGNPAEATSGSYTELREVHEAYWTRYRTSPSFAAYMNVLKSFDQSLFSQIEKLLPARAKSHVGVLIKPNLLERPKFKRHTEHFELLNYSGSFIDQTMYVGKQSYVGGAFGAPMTSSQTGLPISNDTTVDYNNEQTVGFLNAVADVRIKNDKRADLLNRLYNSGSWSVRRDGHFTIGDYISDDIPMYINSKKSRRYKKIEFHRQTFYPTIGEPGVGSSAIGDGFVIGQYESNNLTGGQPITVVASRSLVETEKDDYYPAALKRVSFLGVKHGSVDYSIGGILSVEHDPTLERVGLRSEAFNVIEVLETNPIDLTATELGGQGELDTGPGYAVPINMGDFIDPTVGGGAGTGTTVITQYEPAVPYVAPDPFVPAAPVTPTLPTMNMGQDVMPPLPGVSTIPVQTVTQTIQSTAVIESAAPVIAEADPIPDRTIANVTVLTVTPSPAIGGVPSQPNLQVAPMEPVRDILIPTPPVITLEPVPFVPPPPISPIEPPRGFEPTINIPTPAIIVPDPPPAPAPVSYAINMGMGMGGR